MSLWLVTLFLNDLAEAGLNVFEDGVQFVLLNQFVDRVLDWRAVLVASAVLVSSRIHGLKDPLLQLFNLGL